MIWNLWVYPEIGQPDLHVQHRVIKTNQTCNIDGTAMTE